MTIREFSKQHPTIDYDIDYYFECTCRVCHKTWLERDDEYSIEITDGEPTPGYEFIADEFDVDSSSVKVKGSTIEIIATPLNYDDICEYCEEHYHDDDE